MVTCILSVFDCVSGEEVERKFGLVCRTFSPSIGNKFYFHWNLLYISKRSDVALTKIGGICLPKTETKDYLLFENLSCEAFSTEIANPNQAFQEICHVQLVV